MTVRVLGKLSLSRPVVPTTVVLALAFAVLGLRTAGTDWTLVALAAGLGAVAISAGAAVPWSRLPRWTLVVLPVSCDLVVALLRHAQGGSTSGYAPLTILPVVWVGLALRRREMLAVVLCTAALFAVPLLFFDSTMYPGSGWRGVVLWIVVSTIVGFGANRVIAEQRRQTRQLASVVATQTAIATSPSDLQSVMNRVVDEAQQLTGAAGAVVELPDGDVLEYRAVAGVAAPHLGLRLPSSTALSGLALRSGQVLVCVDSETDTRVDRETCRQVGARSLIVVPLLSDGNSAGVLKVYSPTPNAFRPEHEQVLTLLAGIIGAAVGRAELLRQVREQAVTDELTGLPNRRAWYHHLDAAVARARRSDQPLTVLILDLDHFKEVNDGLGHHAGDQLLRTVSTRWGGALRETDLLGRIGGDEFGVVLEGADELIASDVVSRLESAMPGEHTATAGYAMWDGVEDVASLVARADVAMYERKGRGSRTTLVD